MTNTGLSDVVVRFIGDNIESVEQLEVLLLLRREAARSFSPGAVGRELRIAEGSAAGRLVDLHARGLLQREAAEEYRYRPESAALDDAVARLSAAYAERRVSIINLIFSKPTEKIRSFADAFTVVRRS